MRILTRLGLLLVLIAAVVAWPSPAEAEPVCTQTDPWSGGCTVWVEIPGKPGTPGTPPDDGPKDTGSGESCYWDPVGHGGVGKAGPIPCETENGYWSNELACYITRLDPQPPPGDSSWQGHEPGDGAVYTCYQPQTDIGIWVWFANPPPSSGTGPTPREVAEIAIDSMQLEAIRIGIVPEPGPDRVGLVGMPVWMWAETPDEKTYGPTTASASLGGITITATARTHRITWNMGDGTTVVCRSAGTPYEERFGRQPSPTCGHVYERTSADQPGQKYTVTATSDWVIDWSGAGQTGTIRLNGLSRSVAITVGEAQVLVN
ncbi:hypothetical protein [Nocardioides campestrisoli]|uniref:hypothetical protein n=1 Tax=Nocardioides campestrisoli TaxID=2736757 RepID=UPI00163D95AD|nr:hypothetical protein [Nocardioides campestrisoli]